VIPGFRIETEIGHGGIGVVYRAVRAKDGQPVALKVVMTASGITHKQIERFLRGCSLLAELKHPHIVAYLGSGRAKEFVYLVT
jgi:serine/threonine protein kinase